MNLICVMTSDNIATPLVLVNPDNKLAHPLARELKRVLKNRPLFIADSRVLRRAKLWNLFYNAALLPIARRSKLINIFCRQHANLRPRYKVARSTSGRGLNPFAFSASLPPSSIFHFSRVRRQTRKSGVNFYSIKITLLQIKFIKHRIIFDRTKWSRKG